MNFSKKSGLPPDFIAARMEASAKSIAVNVAVAMVSILTMVLFFAGIVFCQSIARIFPLILYC